MSEMAIGKRRWLVTLANRKLVPETTDNGIGDQWILTNSRKVYANIIPVGSASYINGVQVGFDYTHKIIIRWCSDIDLFATIAREMRLPNGETIDETYKILRYQEYDGRKRFLILETVLEKRVRNG